MKGKPDNTVLPLQPGNNGWPYHCARIGIPLFAFGMLGMVIPIFVPAWTNPHVLRYFQSIPIIGLLLILTSLNPWDPAPNTKGNLFGFERHGKLTWILMFAVGVLGVLCLHLESRVLGYLMFASFLSLLGLIYLHERRNHAKDHRV